MSNGHELELWRDREGQVYLTYWDSLAGKDETFAFDMASPTGVHEYIDEARVDDPDYEGGRKGFHLHELPALLSVLLNRIEGQYRALED
jgi:hypothetical protein